MAAPAPPCPVNVVDDLVEEFLLRLPPEEPAILACAALVNRQWYRVITGPSFRRRFREIHHRSPPLLGYIVNLHKSIRFVSMLLFRPCDAVRRDVEAVHSSHGRVLLQRFLGNDEEFSSFKSDFTFSVWDPIKDEQRDLPVLPNPCPLDHGLTWDAGVVCATMGNCSHLHCHFKVVVVGRTNRRLFSCLYSSEDNSWSDPIFTSAEGCGYLTRSTCVLVGSAMCFRCIVYAIIKYDLLTHQMCVVSVPSSVERRIIEDRTQIPDYAICDPLLFPKKPWESYPSMVGFAETGAGIIFVKKGLGYFTIDLKSGRIKKVGENFGLRARDIVPYVSFFTPGSAGTSGTAGTAAGT